MQWTFRRVDLDPSNSRRKSFWEWTYRSSTRELTAGPFSSFLACVHDAQSHGFRGSDDFTSYTWQSPKGQIHATTGAEGDAEPTVMH
jgi:hypothetical protein